jgi:hypothetical protein
LVPRLAAKPWIVSQPFKACNAAFVEGDKLAIENRLMPGFFEAINDAPSVPVKRAKVAGIQPDSIGLNFRNGAVNIARASRFTAYRSHSSRIMRAGTYILHESR